ncbi:hypothetical protein ACLOJK_026367 [Asimina triloba]
MNEGAGILGCKGLPECELDDCLREKNANACAVEFHDGLREKHVGLKERDKLPLFLGEKNYAAEAIDAPLIQLKPLPETKVGEQSGREWRMTQF